jgi:hypothetical protein
MVCQCILNHKEGGGGEKETSQNMDEKRLTTLLSWDERDWLRQRGKKTQNERKRKQSLFCNEKLCFPISGEKLACQTHSKNPKPIQKRRLGNLRPYVEPLYVFDKPDPNHERDRTAQSLMAAQGAKHLGEIRVHLETVTRCSFSEAENV